MFIYILYFLAIFITIYFVLKKKKIEEALTLAITNNNSVIEYSERNKTTHSYEDPSVAKKFSKVITSGQNDYWALDNSGKSWHKTPSSTWVMKDKQNNSSLSFVDITSDENSVWGLTGPLDNYKVYKKPVNASGVWVDEGNGIKIKKFKQMSASGKGWVWAVDKTGIVWNMKKEQGANWSKTGETKAKQVSGGKNQVFMITQHDNKLYKKSIDGSSSWNPLNKKFKYVSGSSNTYLWGVEITGKVVRAVKPVNRNSIWEEIPHSTGETFKYISGGNIIDTRIAGIISPAEATAAEAASTAAEREAARVAAAKAAGSGERAAAANQRSVPEGTSTGTCSLNCAAPTKITGACEGVSKTNTNPFAKDISGTIKYFKACPYTCLGPQDTGWNDYGPATGTTYDKEMHGCRYTQQCKQCGTVDIEASGSMKEKINSGGNYEYEWVDAASTETTALPFGQNRQLTKCEIDKMQGLHNNNCPPPTEYTSREESEDNSKKGGQVNAADTTMANMFLDINNPHDTGKPDMSLEDYYNKRLLINSGENRLGGSKSAYTNKYKPQNKFGKVRFFNSVWKLF